MSEMTRKAYKTDMDDTQWNFTQPLFLRSIKYVILLVLLTIVLLVCAIVISEVLSYDPNPNYIYIKCGNSRNFYSQARLADFSVICVTASSKSEFALKFFADTNKEVIQQVASNYNRKSRQWEVKVNFIFSSDGTYGFAPYYADKNLREELVVFSTHRLLPDLDVKESVWRPAIGPKDTLVLDNNSRMSAGFFTENHGLAVVFVQPCPCPTTAHDFRTDLESSDSESKTRPEEKRVEQNSK